MPPPVLQREISVLNLTILTGENLSLLLNGLFTTVKVAALGWLLAMAGGVLIGVLRVTPSKLLRIVGSAYVEFFRNIPLLVIIFFIYFALPSAGIRLSGFASATLGLGIYTAAFIAEVIRSGIAGIPRGQLEAALASGLTYLQAMRYVILPQAVRYTIPPLGNQTINLIKNSALASTVSVADILFSASLIGDRTFAYTTALTAAAVLYLVITIPTALVVNYVERRMRLASR